jgi:hypothetical protein
MSPSESIEHTLTEAYIFSSHTPIPQARILPIDHPYHAHLKEAGVLL